MTNEEKILEVLEKLNGRMEHLETNQAALEGYLGRLKSELALTNLGMKGLEHKQAAFEGHMGRFETVLDDMKAGQDKLQDDFTTVKLRLDLDFEKRFDAVNEGIDAILRQLKSGVPVENRVDKLEEDVSNLKTVAKLHSADIADLKRAQ